MAALPEGSLEAAMKAITDILGIAPKKAVPEVPLAQQYPGKPWLKKVDTPPAPQAPWPGKPVKPAAPELTSEQLLNENLPEGGVTLAQRKMMLARALKEVNDKAEAKAAGKPIPIMEPPKKPTSIPINKPLTDVGSQPPVAKREILPEPQRQAARQKGKYTSPAYRGMQIQPGKDVGSVFKGSTMYSTADPVLADMYSSYISSHPTGKASGSVPTGSFSQGATVSPLWIDTSDYLYADAKGAHWGDFNYKAIAQAKDAKKKGVIIDNVWDEPNSTHSLGSPRKIYITFDPKTAKSRFASHFDPTSPDQLRSIAAIGIGGAAGGYVAMAAPEAKAGEQQQWPGQPVGKQGQQWPGTPVGTKAPQPSAPPTGAPTTTPAAAATGAPTALDPRSVKERLAGAAPSAMNAPGVLKAIAGYPGHLAAGLEETAKGAFEASESLRAGGEYDPRAPMGAALMTAGAGAGARGGLVPNRRMPPVAAAPHTPPGTTGPLPGGIAPPGGSSPGGAPPAPPIGGGHPPGAPPAAPPTGGAPPAPPTGGAAPAAGAATPIQAARNAFGVIEKLLSPETVDADAKRGAAMIREATGTAERSTAQSSAAIEGGWRKVNSLPAQDQLNFIDYVQGRTQAYTGYQMADPELQALSDVLKNIFEKRMNELQGMTKFQQMSFVQDYFPQMWKERGAAAVATPVPPKTGTAGAKTGSGASLKKRTIPTYADGIAQGLTPVTTNPLEATMRYVASMDRFIGQQRIWETAQNEGMIKFIHLKVVGASGHPDSFKVPDGWMALKGRGATNQFGAQAYAPEGFARVYNNWIDRGIGEKGEEWQQGYDFARRVSNSVTGLELSLSGYHFLTVGKAALDNSMAQAINLLRSGKPVAAVKQLGKTAVAPVRYARSGKQVKDVYLGLSQGNPQLNKVVDELTKAGGRAVGRAHAPEYEFSKGGSFHTAIKRGALRLQLAADRAQATTGPAWSRPFREAHFAAKQIGRIMDTVAAPLFEQYIPAVKNGAFRENLSNWMQAHPNATQEEITNAARQTWDDIDDRFGEMVSENMFMGTLIKQIGQLALRSWSWTVGQDVRMLGGAARDVVRAPFKKPTGTGPHDTRWTSKMDQAIAMPIVYGTLAAIYQTLKTGQSPQDFHDLAAPRTGGIDAATQKPQRLLLPGPEKDVFGFGHDFPAGATQETGAKMATVLGQAFELWRNQDYRGDPHFSSAQNAPPWLTQVWEYAAKEFGPISLRNLGKGREKGSNISRIEQILGVRNAPRYLTDPEGYSKMMQGVRTQAEKKKILHERKQQRLYEGDQ